MLGKIYAHKDDINIFVKRQDFGSFTMKLGNEW